MLRKLLLVLTIMLLVAGCYPSEEFSLGEPVEIDHRQTVSNSEENLRIRFDKVVSDDRCPVEYNCIVPGNAQVQLTLRKGHKRETIVLNTYDSPELQIALGYQIQASNLEPPNSADNPPSQKDYTVTLWVYPPHPEGLCDSNADCDEGDYCDPCGTSSCPMCDDCVPACRPL